MDPAFDPLFEWKPVLRQLGRKPLLWKMAGRWYCIRFDEGTCFYTSGWTPFAAHQNSFF